MKQILIPDLGDINDVEVIEIPIEVGDEIQKEDTMVVLESDKATMEVPAPESGVVKEILVSLGSKVSEGTPVLMIQSQAGTEVKEEPQSSHDNAPSETQEDSTQMAQEDAIQTEAPSSAEENPVTLEQDIVIPDIGDLDDVEVIELSVNNGDDINKEQTLLVLESDKASMEVPASQSGKITSLTVKVGDKVNTGSVIGTILVTDSNQKTESSSISKPTESKPESAPHKKSANPVTQADQRPPVPERPAMQTPPRKGIPHASPAVRRFARELGADLAKVRGSGPKSRILKSDIQQFVKDELSKPATGGSGLQVAELPKIDYAKFGEVEEVPLSRIQKISSVNLHRNWVSIPHVTQFDEADITDLEIFRKSLKDEAQQKGVKMTPLVFMLKAAAAALKAFPTFNSSLSSDGENLILKKYFHIGVAVDTPKGLVVPVIRDVDQKSCYELAAELGEISIKAREGKLSPASMQGSCFSISSLGGIGGTAFTPIVNWPDVAILGVSRSQMKPVWDGKEFEPRLMLPLSLSYDHRVIDGAVAARFIVHLSKVLGDFRRVLL